MAMLCSALVRRLCAGLHGSFPPLRDGRAPHLLPPLYPPALPTAVADAGTVAAPTPMDAGRLVFR